MIEKKYHIVHTESSGGWGGQEIRILSESKEFIRLGHKVTLICSNKSPIADAAKELMIPYIELPIGKKNFKGLFALRKWISNNSFDIVNTHSSSDSWMTAIALRLTFKKKPLVRTRHVSAPVSNNRATRWLYQKASDHIVTTGEKLKETLIRENGINPKKITSVPTGIDCQKYIPADNKELAKEKVGLPKEKVIIGIVATLRSWKGHEYLIDAFHQINNSNTHLLIVGDGPQWENINKKIQTLGLSDKSTLTGNQKNVTPWLQAMDIFALPSYANEGVPQSIMQAMSCGLPIISTNVGSIAEIVNHDHGIIVEPQNTQSIYNALNKLIKNDNERKVMGEKATVFAKKNCSITNMTEAMKDVFINMSSDEN